MSYCGFGHDLILKIFDTTSPVDAKNQSLKNIGFI